MFSCVSTAEVQKLKNIFKQLQDTEDDHERYLGGLDTADEHKFGSGGQTYVQAPASTTTTTNNDGHIRDRSSVNVGRFWVGRRQVHVIYQCRWF